jgi:hypothetical protein
VITKHGANLEKANKTVQFANDFIGLIESNPGQYKNISLERTMYYNSKADLSYMDTTSKANFFKGRIVAKDGEIGFDDVMNLALKNKINIKNIILHCGDDRISVVFHQFYQSNYYSVINLRSQVDAEMEENNGFALFTNKDPESVRRFIFQYLKQGLDFEAYLFYFQ